MLWLVQKTKSGENHVEEYCFSTLQQADLTAISVTPVILSLHQIDTMIT